MMYLKWIVIWASGASTYVVLSMTILSVFVSVYRGTACLCNFLCMLNSAPRAYPSLKLHGTSCSMLKLLLFDWKCWSKWWRWPLQARKKGARVQSKRHGNSWREERAAHALCVHCNQDNRIPNLCSAANTMDPGPVPPQLQVSSN